MSAPISPTSTDAAVPAINAANNGSGGLAVYGYSAHGHGVEGGSVGSKGVVGTSTEFQGVYGHSDKNAGVVGESATWVGVYGRSMGPTGIAMMGEARADGKGVPGDGTGVLGASTGGAGVSAVSVTGEAVHAETNSPNLAGVAVFNNNPTGTGAALFAKKAGAVGHAGFFDGDVKITRRLYVDLDVYCTGADLAEQFGVVGELEADPGSVVVLTGDDQVRVSDQPYDRRVAGIVSGAGTYRPALVLDRREDAGRRPVALTGKVWCKADAENGPIELGDLLTSSPTPGHAMRAEDPTRAFGAVVGKALAALPAGRGLIPVLVSLQ
jgi:hypothetical protein